MTRSQSREQAFIIVFEKEFHNEYTVENIIEAARETEVFDASEFASELAMKAAENAESIDEIIQSKLKAGWKIDRISKVSLAILRIAICEILYFEDIPTSVSINEAVELAKKYSAAEDASFVNGLLSAVAKDNVNEQ